MVGIVATDLREGGNPCRASNTCTEFLSFALNNNNYKQIYIARSLYAIWIAAPCRFPTYIHIATKLKVE